ncbi:hypothetical protein GDO86_000398 [Hymenochirus boettgeri]|uniref:H/ACA ribonucleoprotein complex non-core subunit NAF1 n=1 Tax=Hymenochirus boettgeri TaxID=247094 RepID=A0A8T2KHB4_9PIPI|nr:hypothetical protein GDO86_000398 [Hymenochirus boettgeri]
MDEQDGTETRVLCNIQSPICKSEIVDNGTCSQYDGDPQSSSNHNNNKQGKLETLPLALEESVEGMDKTARPQTLPLDQEEGVEVAVKMGNLHFDVDFTSNSDEKAGALAMGCPQVCSVNIAEAARNGNEMFKSSSEDSGSDSDSDSSSSSSSILSIPKVEEDEPIGANEGPLKTKDELLLNDLPEVEEVSITLPEEVELKPFGIVSSIIEQLVIIESLKDVPPLNEDSVIFKDDRNAVGKIFEIFGPVPHPFYVIRFNTKDQIEARSISIKDTMFFAPTVVDFTQYIIPDKLKIDKGSDASWTNDQEPPKDALDFSDDEKEREAKQKKKSHNLSKKKTQSDQSESGMFQEQNRTRQNYSRPPSRNNYGPRFSRGRASHLQECTFRHHQGPFFQPGFPSQPIINQPYAFHNLQSQEYSPALPSNGHGPPPIPSYFGSQYENIHHLHPPPAPPPDMIWPDQNSHFMPNLSFYPPPPPPPVNPDQSPFGPNY